MDSQVLNVRGIAKEDLKASTPLKLSVVAVILIVGAMHSSLRNDEPLSPRLRALAQRVRPARRMKI